MNRVNALIVASTCCAPVLVTPTAAMAQSTITLFGQSYSVQRFDYSDLVRLPGVTFPGEQVRIFEAEGVAWAGNNTLLMSADDQADVFIGEPDNWIVEVNVLMSGTNVTGLSGSRRIVTVDSASYDPNPGGVTINPTSSGIGAGGNLVVGGNEGFIYAYRRTGPETGTLLQTTSTEPCPNQAGGCNLDISLTNFNLEDITFVPALGNRPASFYTINQDLVGLDASGIECRSLQGNVLGSFPVAGAAFPALNGAVAKGITYIPDSPGLPASIRRPEGIVLVSFDRLFPALQAFSVDGELLGTEIMTINGQPSGASRLDLSGCTLRLHIESLTADPQTGRLFLVNQGSFLNCNYMWVLTPNVAPSCLPDVAGPNQSIGPDGNLTADDIIVFLGWYFASDTRADVAGANQSTTPDGQFTADDIIVFLGRYFAGC